MLNHCSLKGILLTAILSPGLIFSQVSVLTQHNDLNRTGWNNHESILNLQNVNSSQFGRLFSLQVDDQIWGQPLIVNGLNIAGAVHNVVILTTVNNSVYAFDADSVNLPTPYWQVNLTPDGQRAVKNTDMTGACGGQYNNFLGNIGIVGTPVIDTNTKTMFLVTKSVNMDGATAFTQNLHALDIRTGKEKANSPVLVTAQAMGDGDASTGGVITFDQQKQNQRPGLLLLNGRVYFGFSSYCDWDPYHGWFLSYDTGTLQQVASFISTPNGSEGGIWMSGMGPAADSLGNIYLAVGNGSADGQPNESSPINSGESIVKLTPTGNQLPISSFFTPTNYQYLDDNDLDMGVVQVMLIPGTRYLVSGDKNGELFLVNRDTMGNFSATTNQVIQQLNLGESSNLHACLSYYGGSSGEWMYVWSENSALTAFPFVRSQGMFNLDGVVTGPSGPYGQNGAFLSVSSNGSDDSTAILWAAHAMQGDAESTTDPGILRAFSASNPSREIWNSSQNLNDQPGNYAKFVPPTIANGKVYLATFSNQLVVYGLTSNRIVDTCSSSNVAMGKTAYASSTGGNSSGPAEAVDGNFTTAWISLASDPQNIYIDLGQSYRICQVVLSWDFSAASDFSIQVSDDALNWTTIASVNANSALTNVIQLSGVGRYIRMLGEARNGSGGYALFEFQVYGTPLIQSANLLAPIAFPNPAQHFLHLLGGTDNIVELEIVDATGRMIAHIINSNNNRQIDIPMTGLAKGMYFLRVKTAGQTFHMKVLHVN